MKIPENFLEYVKAHKDCTEETYAYASSLKPEDVELAVDPEALRIKKMVCHVLGEIHRMRGFVRLAQLSDAAAYGYLDPVHDVGRWVAAALSKRFEGTLIVLGNSRRSWMAYNSPEGRVYAESGPLQESIEKLKDALEITPAQDAAPLWETYRESQNRVDRPNVRLFRKNMPRKSLKAAGLATEAREDYTSLRRYV